MTCSLRTGCRINSNFDKEKGTATCPSCWEDKVPSSGTIGQLIHFHCRRCGHWFFGTTYEEEEK